MPFLKNTSSGDFMSEKYEACEKCGSTDIARHVTKVFIERVYQGSHQTDYPAFLCKDCIEDLENDKNVISYHE
jgi:hypothetical protein